MRSVSTQCDPRSVVKWSQSWIVVNGAHVTGKAAPRTYVSRMFSLAKDLIGAMREDGAIVTTDPLSSDVRSFVEDAEALFRNRRSDDADLVLAMTFLDEATLLALAPPSPGLPYVSTSLFDNPKGELVSHLTALRYALCSEFALPLALMDNPSLNLGFCNMDGRVVTALPTL